MDNSSINAIQEDHASTKEHRTISERAWRIVGGPLGRECRVIDPEGRDVTDHVLSVTVHCGKLITAEIKVLASLDVETSEPERYS